MWSLPWEMFSLHFFLKEYWAWEIGLMLFLIERSVMAGCISEIPMRKDSACLLTELQMSNDPSTREVSSAAQGIKMAQIITGISKNWVWLSTNQSARPAVCGEKEKALISLRFSTGFSLMIIIFQPLLNTSLCSSPSSPPLSLQTLLQSRSASPLGHHQTECSALWVG